MGHRGIGCEVGVEGAEVGPGEEAGVVSVGEANAQGVVADEFGGESGEGGGGLGGGENGEGVGGDLLAEGLGIGAGREAAEKGDGEEGGGAIGPLDSEANGSLEVEAEGVGVGHWGREDHIL